VPDPLRIEELRRRVEADPASIAFAQLAEECRRMGQLEEAVRVCRAGLEQHPAYLSAHVTLGRALMELGQFDEARAAFERVLLSAPDNLVALRSMADIHQRVGAEGSPEPAHGEQAAARVAVNDPGEPMVEAPSDPALPELERWLAAILEDRVSRAAS
jgi:tetratricopeptide (TPR) repeat protein